MPVPPPAVGLPPPPPAGLPPPLPHHAPNNSMAGSTVITRPASILVTHLPPHLATHHRCLRELAFAALQAAADGKKDGQPQQRRGVCRGVTLHKLALPNNDDGGDGKENGGSMAVASVQMSSVEGAQFLAAAYNALARTMAAAAASEGDGDTGDKDGKDAETATKGMRAYVALPPGLTDEENGGEVATEDVDADVIEQMRKVERGLWRQYDEDNRKNMSGAAGDDADAAAGGSGAKATKEEKDEERTKTEDAIAESENANEVIKIDVSKVAAAAGGGEYDEEEDALNAPEVLAAVAAFKRRNNERDAHLRKRRVEIVDRRLGEETQKAKERLVRMEEERKKAEADRAARAVMASVGVGVGIGAETKDESVAAGKEGAGANASEAPAPDGGAVDTGKRGVSNLPAWMSKGETTGNTEASAPPQATNADEQKAGEEESNSRKRKFVPSEANRDVNTRKQRIDAGEGMSMAEIRAANEAADKKKAAAATTKEDILKAGVTFPPVPADSVPKMKQYVTDQIVELLGEAEDSMINFVLGALTVPKSPAGCLVSSMLEEMQPVLDEDAEDFVVDLYRTVAGLS